MFKDIIKVKKRRRLSLSWFIKGEEKKYLKCLNLSRWEI